MIVSKALFSDLLDMAIFRSEELGEARVTNDGAYNRDMQRRLAQTNEVILAARAVWDTAQESL